MKGHECPAHGCTKIINHDQLACPPHWVKLPWRMRTNLTEAWRLQDYSQHRRALNQALQWYRTHDVDASPESRGGHTSTTLESGTDAGGE